MCMWSLKFKNFVSSLLLCLNNLQQVGNCKQLSSLCSGKRNLGGTRYKEGGGTDLKQGDFHSTVSPSLFGTLVSSLYQNEDELHLIAVERKTGIIA